MLDIGAGERRQPPHPAPVTSRAGGRSLSAAGLAGASRAGAGPGDHGRPVCPARELAILYRHAGLGVLRVIAMTDPAAFAARDGASALTDRAGVVPHGWLRHQSSLVRRCATSGLRRIARHRPHRQPTIRGRPRHEANVTDRTGRLTRHCRIGSRVRPAIEAAVTRGYCLAVRLRSPTTDDRRCAPRGSNFTIGARPSSPPSAGWRRQGPADRTEEAAGACRQWPRRHRGHVAGDPDRLRRRRSSWTAHGRRVWVRGTPAILPQLADRRERQDLAVSPPDDPSARAASLLAHITEAVARWREDPR